MDAAELDALTSVLVLEDLGFLEFSCARGEATSSESWGQFDELSEGDAAVDLNSERHGDRLLHTCRVRVKGPGGSRFRVEVQANYSWAGPTPEVTDEDLEEYCLKRGSLVLLPFAREALISAGSRLRIPAPLLPIATGDVIEHRAQPSDYTPVPPPEGD